MLTKLRLATFLTCIALLAANPARGQALAPVDKPLTPPKPIGEVVTQSYTDDAPLYNPADAAGSIAASSTAATTAKSPQPMTASEMARRPLGTPEVAPSTPTASLKPKTVSNVFNAAANLPVEPTVSSGQPTAAPRAGLVSKPSVAVAAAPAADPSEDAVPRDTRPLSQRLKALRQPASEKKSESWEQPATDPIASGLSSRRGQTPAAETDTPAHPLSLSETTATPIPAPASPEPEANQAPAETLAPLAPTASSHPAGMKSSRRTVVNPEELATSEPAPAVSDNVLFKRQSPLLSVETAGPRTVVIGKEALYVVTLSNGGDAAAQDLVVGVKIPDWTDVVGSQPSAGTTRASLADGSEPFQWRLQRLEAHSKETLSLRLVPRKGRPFDLNVQWTFSPTASQTMVDVQEPKLVMNIAGPDEVVFGQSKLYRLTLSNPGTGKAENVSIDLWPVGNPTAAPTRHPLGALSAGESKVVELELTARQGGTVTIHASASADPSLKAEVHQEVLVRRAAVAVTIDGAKSRYAGTVAGYTIKVTNPGNAPAENVRVSAALPPQAKFTSATQGGQWKADQAKVVWTLPTLRSGEEQVLDLRCTLSTAGANKLQVLSSAAGDLTDTADMVTNVEALADLKLDVSEPAGPIAVGDEMVYELRVRNRGTKSADSVAVIAYFSEGIEPTSADGGTHDISNGVVAFRPLASLAVGGEVVYRIHARAQKNGKQMFRTEVECGTLGTKLVSAEEAMIYPADGGSPSPSTAVASRPADPAGPTPTAAPAQPKALPAGTRR